MYHFPTRIYARPPQNTGSFESIRTGTVLPPVLVLPPHSSSGCKNASCQKPFPDFRGKSLTLREQKPRDLRLP